MTNDELIHAFELAEESVAGFAPIGSFEMILAEALLTVRKAYNADMAVMMKRLERALESTPSDSAVQVKPWEFNMLTQGKEDMVGKPIAWSQWPMEEKNNG
jgi:hypothetical protein